MAYHQAVGFRNERYRQRPGRSQSRNDELLGLIADRQGLERCDRNIGYDVNIADGLAPDCDFRFHVSLFFQWPTLRITHSLPLRLPAPELVGQNVHEQHVVKLVAIDAGFSSFAGLLESARIIAFDPAIVIGGDPKHDAMQIQLREGMLKNQHSDFPAVALALVLLLAYAHRQFGASPGPLYIRQTAHADQFVLFTVLDPEHQAVLLLVLGFKPIGDRLQVSRKGLAAPVEDISMSLLQR